MPFILIWKSSRFWNVRISVGYLIFLSALLVTSCFQFSLFLTFFYLDSGGLILSVMPRNADCPVISKWYFSDRSGLPPPPPSCLYFSLILTHLSSAACSVLALSSQSGLYYFHLVYFPCPSPCYFLLPPSASVSSFTSFLMLFLPFSYFPCPVVSTVPVDLIPLQILWNMFPTWMRARLLRKLLPLCRWECWAGGVEWKLRF